MFKSCLFFSFGDETDAPMARELRPAQATKRDAPAMTNGKCSVKALATRQAHWWICLDFLGTYGGEVGEVG